jgi:hypothetical protein
VEKTAVYICAGEFVFSGLPLAICHLVFKNLPSVGFKNEFQKKKTGNVQLAS